MNYVIFAAAILLTTTFNSIYNYMGKKRLDGTAGRFICLTCVFAAGALVMLFFIFPGGSLSPYTLLMGAIFAAVLFFPIYHGGNILLSALAGRAFFKEKMTRSQTVGFFIGIAAILLLGNLF